MKRVCEGISWFLASFGFALLMLSLLLVPQGYVLAQSYGGTCNGDSCDTGAACAILYPDCPGANTPANLCSIGVDPADCGGCKCIYTTLIATCLCRSN
jgi:hypothetical protein